MRDPLACHPFEVTAAEDQHPVETLPPARPDLPLHVRVGRGRRDRSLDHSDPSTLDDPNCGAHVLGVVIVDQDPLPGTLQLPHQVASLLGHPVATGWSVTANQTIRLVASSIYKRTKSRPKNTVSTLKKSLRTMVEA